ncbi:hypothetical protein HN51_10680 [Ectopseudomonas mendocina]|uniref:Uncharacterized protein n=1 Tax=Ectopseudomonas mendocina S5.2 TaxID=1225174 RepID=A0ABM5VVH4_ECTME|nr:hypothetical protein DW68_009505 [Pseudomonas mendocina S5.2]KES00287.1 hypothetical protein HN51_10680 [Pseudomonas mendocina]
MPRQNDTQAPAQHSLAGQCRSLPQIEEFTLLEKVNKPFPGFRKGGGNFYRVRGQQCRIYLSLPTPPLVITDLSLNAFAWVFWRAKYSEVDRRQVKDPVLPHTRSQKPAYIGEQQIILTV